MNINRIATITPIPPAATARRARRSLSKRRRKCLPVLYWGDEVDADMANGVLRGDGAIMQQPPGIGEYTFGIDIAFSMAGLTARSSLTAREATRHGRRTPLEFPERY